MADPVLRARLAAESIERPLRAGVYSIGRGGENDIALDDFSLSRRHARLTVDGDGSVWVEDLGSSGGTHIDGERIPARSRQRVPEGASLRFGEVEASIDMPAAPAEAPTEAPQVPGVPEAPLAAMGAVAAGAAAGVADADGTEIVPGDAGDITPAAAGVGSTDIADIAANGASDAVAVADMADGGFADIETNGASDALADMADGDFADIETNGASDAAADIADGDFAAIEANGASDAVADTAEDLLGTAGDDGTDFAEEVATFAADDTAPAEELAPLGMIAPLPDDGDGAGAAAFAAGTPPPPPSGTPDPFAPGPPAFDAPLVPPPPPPLPPPPVASSVRLAVSATSGPIEPGQAAQVTVVMTNRGHIVDEVALSVSDLPPEWVTIAPASHALMPGTQAEATITVRPPRSSSAPAGTYPLTVVAHSAGSGAETVAVSNFTLGPFEDFAIALDPAQATRDFTVQLRNNGNVPAAFDVSARDDENALQFDLPSDRLAADPGATDSLALKVKPAKRKFTGPKEVKAFKVQLAPENGTKVEEIAGRLMVEPVIGSPRRLLMLLIALLVGLGAVLAVLFFKGGDEPVQAEIIVPTPTPVPEAVLATEEDTDVHLCSPEESGPPPPPAPGTVRDRPSTLAAFGADVPNIDPTAPLFAQNDSRWGNDEYAKANDEEFRGQNLCGSTIAQCGCAMTSVATVMSLFQIATMPDGQALTPEQLNNWLNIGAERTSRGWVSQGYIYGDVIWAAANQLSAEIAKARPGTPTMRFRSTGDGSEAQIRSELAAGRPIILEVPGHWIAAIGIDPATNQILINDPYYADRTTLDVYAGKVRSSVMFEPSTNLSALVVTVPSDLRVRLIDGSGHVVGTFDRGTPDEAAAKAIRDIPGASYVFKHTWRDPNCINRTPGPDDGTNQIILTGPAAEKYRIEVVNPTGGPTSVAIHHYDEDGNLSMRTEESTDDLRVDIDLTKPTPTMTATATGTTAPSATATATRPGDTATPTHTATNTATSTATSTSTATPTATNTATPTQTATPTPTPTRAPAPPSVGAPSCLYSVQEHYGETAQILFTCHGSASGPYDSTHWYIVEPSGEQAELFDYAGSSDMQYVRIVAERDFFTIVFEACNQGRCARGTQNVTVTSAMMAN